MCRKRRLFESFLVLQDRPTGTTPMAGGQSLRLLALSSAQSSAAHSFGRPLTCSLGHSVARSLFRSLSLPARSPLRSTARPLFRPLAWSRARSSSSPRSLSSSFDRSLVFLLASAGPLACWFGSMHARSRSHLCPRGARPCDRSLVLGRSSSRSLRLLGRSFGRPLVFLVAWSSIRLVALSLIRLLTVSFVCSAASWFAC